MFGKRLPHSCSNIGHPRNPRYKFFILNIAVHSHKEVVFVFTTQLVSEQQNTVSGGISWGEGYKWCKLAPTTNYTNPERGCNSNIIHAIKNKITKQCTHCFVIMEG